MKKILMISAMMLLASTGAMAQPTGIIRGTVTDEASGQPLTGVTIVVLNDIGGRGVSHTPTSLPSVTIGTTTDLNGVFVLPALPVGRYNVQASFVGYESAVMREVMVSSSKETVLGVSMKESVETMDEVVIRAKVNKEAPLNAMALAGARMLSVDEASRYAGGFDDPARLVTAFAGVAGDVTSNAIAIRGNAPQFLQWKLEDVEIPNPSHYPEIGGVGGGILTAFSSQVLGNSDFFTGAFPAEYNNALAGVFDMKLRNGNNERYEHTAQLGTLGLEFASEGPFSRNGQGSYLFNYRYSSMALAGKLMGGDLQDVAGMKYQDLSFKVNLPTRKAGTFSLWGIGTHDRYISPEPADFVNYDYLPSQGTAKQSMGVVGLGHKIFVGNDSYLKTTLAATYANNHQWSDKYTTAGEAVTIEDMLDENTNIVLQSYLNTKFSARHTNRSGITFTELLYNNDYWLVPNLPYGAGPMQQFGNADGHSSLVSAFTQSSFQLGKHWSALVGINAQYFALNGHWTLEPRASIRWQAAPHHSIALAYGLHSRHEKLEYYFVITPESGDIPVNKDLDFTKAHHLVLSYDWHITDNLHFKAEPYFQYLFDVPVVAGSYFSIINQSDFWMDKTLVNGGRGRNYGLDLTLERYLNKGWYYLVTASLFESKYEGGDGVWRNTRLNRKFLVNVLGGKEWMLGSKKQNILGVSLRASAMGGSYYTPVNQEASKVEQRPIFDETRPYSLQSDPGVMVHLTVSFKINKPKLSHEFAIKLLNVTGYKDFFGFDYNFRTQQVDQMTAAITIPNICYKVEFLK